MKNGRNSWLLAFVMTLLLSLFGVAAYRFHWFVKNPALKPAVLPPHVEPPFKHPLLLNSDSLRDEGRFDLAHHAYLETAAHFLKEKNWKGYVWSLNAAGSAGIRGENQIGARTALRKALLAGNRHLGKNHRFVGNTCYFLGEYYYMTSEDSSSLYFHKQALKIRQYLFGKNGNLVADSYQQIAQVYQYLAFDYSAADAYLDSVLQVSRKIPERGLRDEASIYYDLVAVNRLKGDLEKALLFANKYMVIAEKLDDPVLLELAHSTTGSIYFSQADYKNAIFHLKQAIALNSRNKPVLNGQNNLSYYYNDLGNAFRQTGNMAFASQSFQNALKASVSTASADTLAISNSYASLGNLFLKQADFDSSRFYFDKCLSVRLTYFGKKHYKTAQAYKNLGDFYFRIGRFDLALSNYQQAEIAAVPDFDKTAIAANPAVEAIGKRYELIDIMGSKGKTLLQRYRKGNHNKSDLLLSLNCFQTADSLIQNYAESYGSESSMLSLAQESHAIYEQALACTNLLRETTRDASYNSYALYFMERSKAQLLLQGVRRAEQLNTDLIPDSLRNLEKELGFKINRLQQQQEEYINRKSHDKTVQKIRSELLEVNLKYQELQKNLDSRYPFLKASGSGKQMLSLPDLQQSLRGSDKQMMTYFWGDSSIYILGITARQSKFVRITKTKNLSETLTRFVKNLSGKSHALSTKEDYLHEFTRYTRQAYDLYQQLVKPALLIQDQSFKDYEKPIPKLVIVPDGPLAYLPFSALLTRMPSKINADYHSLSYLLYRFSSSYAYSAALLAHQIQHQSGTASPGVLAFAYTDAESGNSGLSDAKQIPGSARELAAIERMMNGLYLKGKDATEENFVKNASGYRIIHLAVHGSTDEKSKYESRLVFNSDKTAAQDGILYAHELYNLKLGARLVVLSACETALGKLFSGEGVFSMARGFTFGGCPSLIMSLWKVDDAATTELMENLYKGLHAGMSIDESLETSQQHYLRTHDELSAHPRYWAGFIASGDMAPIESGPQDLWIAVFSISLLMIVSLLFIYKRK